LQSREACREAMADFFDAFPDATNTLNHFFFASDKSVRQGTWHATQRKEWERIASTGRKTKWTVVIIGV
jgi:predicted ester cyclase